MLQEVELVKGLCIEVAKSCPVDAPCWGPGFEPGHQGIHMFLPWGGCGIQGLTFKREYWTWALPGTGFALDMGDTEQRICRS